MSEAVFKWQPHLATAISSVKYDTLISNFENGMTQRRSRFNREIGVWKFIYKMSLMSHSDMIRVQDEILEFFKARKGSYDNFYIPSWEYESKYASKDVTNKIVTVTTDSTVNGVMTKLGFSATVGAQGNFACLCSRFGTSVEVGQVDTLGTNTITFKSSLSGTFDTSYLVMKAFKVYFEADDFERNWNTPFAWDKEITFIEDIGGLY